MILLEIENIYTAIVETSSIAALPLKIKLGLYKIKLEPYISLIENFKKEFSSEDSTFFETKRFDIMQSDNSNKELELTNLINEYPIQFNSYMEAIKKIESIYSYECGEDVPKLSLTIEEVPDDLETLSKKTQKVLFSLIEE